MKDILTLTNKEARAFFMKEESYISADLPDYFKFSPLLEYLSVKLDYKTIDDFILDPKKENSPKKFEGVNYKILSNKDGRYSWRPIQLIHPLLYVSLVNLITTKENWSYIKERISSMIILSENIHCMSWPTVTGKFKKNKANQIIEWNDNVTKRSIKNSMKYSYIFTTDLSDCYGSIYTHAISWALHDKVVSKNPARPKGLIGDEIDRLLQAMSHGQTNGIPQGSVVMDFIAEILLCYIDFLLSSRIKELKIDDFEIIRYRDDYRIFVNNPSDAEIIIKELTEILNDYGMKINSAKTESSDNIVRSAIKPDKYNSLINSDISGGSTFNSLLKINDFTDTFNNSKITAKLLQNFYYQNYFVLESISIDEMFVMISLVINIAIKNPTTYPIAFAILSRFLDILPNDARPEIIENIIYKFNKLPNTGLMEIWLQRITISTDENRKYQEKLCNKIVDSSIVLWNSEWIIPDIRTHIDNYDVADRKALGKIGAIIEVKEVELFNDFEYF